LANCIAGIATIVATKTIEQFTQSDTREVKQMTTGTADIAAHIITRIAVRCGIARIAVGGTSEIQVDAFEQILKAELRSTTSTTRVTIGNNIARIALDLTAGVTIVRGKQVAQTSAQVELGSASHIARIAISDFITRIAGDDCVTRIAGTRTNSVDQFLETGEEVALHDAPVARCTRINTCRIARTRRKTLHTHHEGSNESSHQNSDFHGVISPFRFVGPSDEEPVG